MTDDILIRAKSYLTHNAAESGADVLIADLIEEVERLRTAAGSLGTMRRALEDIANLPPALLPSQLVDRFVEVRVRARAALTPYIRCDYCGAEWAASGDGEVHQHDCPRRYAPVPRS